MKTIKEIADDCGLDSHSLRPSTLEKIVNGRYFGSTLYEESLYEIIGALYRRIEKLEAEKAAAVDMLQSVSLDCQMALCGDWDKADEDDAAGRCPHGMFHTGAGACPQCTADAPEESVRRPLADRILAENVSEEAYRDEWNCPSCGGESEDDDDDARRCHPCGLRFTPAEEAP